MCKSHATYQARIKHNILCPTRYEETALLLSKTELKSHLFLLFAFLFFGYKLVKPFTNEGEEETGVPKRTPDDGLQKMTHSKARKFKPQPRLEPAF